MKIRTRTLPLALLLALSPLGLSLHAQDNTAQNTTAPLQQRMSSDEFKAAGLDKLSPQELDNLNAWLNGHSIVKTVVKKETVDSSGKPVFVDPTKRTRFSAHLVGHFDGWSEGAQLTLDNGQVWKEVGSDAPSCMSADNPVVKLKPSLLGTWLMYVDGCNGDAHVERVR
jgi:hypothetical protein